MKGEIRYEIATGPLDEEWLEAEFYIGEQPFATLTEWGKKLIIYAPCKINFEIDTEEFISLILMAKKRVSNDFRGDE